METVVLDREQVAPVVEYVGSELRDKNPGLTFYISGPWRRGAEKIDQIIVVIVSADLSLVDGEGEPLIVLPSALEHFEEKIPPMWESKLRTEFGFVRTLFILTKPMALGATLLWTTGPEVLWSAFKLSARQKGLKLATIGLFSPDLTTQLDDGTEYDIVSKLDGSDFLALVDPKKRENWVSVLREQMELTKDVVTIEIVTSSDGARDYEIWIDRTGRGIRCECKGFSYRGVCRHLEMAETIHAARGSLGARPVEDRV